MAAPRVGWQNEKGATEALFAFSKEVKTLQGFISHSWSDGRWAKYLCLLALYNGPLALVVACAFWFLMALGVKFVMVPLAGDLEGSFHRRWRGYIASHVFYVIFVFYI